MLFDPKNESSHLTARDGGTGDAFGLLGVTFDGRLSMAAAVEEIVASCRWESKQLLKMTGVLSHAEMRTHYKAQILSKIECKTAAVNHATDTTVAALDKF